MENQISDPPEEQTQALARVDAPAQNIVVAPVTAAQARVESVAQTLDAAYKNASTLKLTKEEADELTADFPDEAFELGAGGDKNLLYLSHVYLRQRLNKVLGVGAVVPIRRREWSEEFTYQKDGRTKQAARVYVDLVLIVRGCVVGEAIGDAIFYKDNMQDSYSDTLEKAKSNAFRRCCKEFGVGLQPWMKGFCEAWKQRNRGGSQNARREYPVSEQRTYQKPAPQPSQERKTAAPADVLPAKATDRTREWAWNTLAAQFDAQTIWDYFVGKGWVQGDGTYDQWPLEHVPTSKQALAALADEIRMATTPQSQPVVDSDDLPPEIAQAVITLPRRGMRRADYLANPDTIGGLYGAMKAGDEDAKKRFWGVIKGWTPEPYVGSDGKKHQPSQADLDSRAACDAFLDWYEQKHGKAE